MRKVKTEKWFVAGIPVWRVKIELNNKTRDTINIESWDKKVAITLAKDVIEKLSLQ